MVCNWGIIGPGYVATRAVLPALQKVTEARVLGVASRSLERASSAAARFQIPNIYTDYMQLLENPHISVVYLALPNHLHREWTLRAAAAGKHILCEKPLALNAAEATEMILACQRAGVVCMEAVMYRFHPRMQALRNMLSGGRCGRIRLLHAAFAFPFQSPENYRASPQSGGGALLDVGSYCLNAVQWLLGQEPVEARGFSFNNERGIDVSTSAVLRFADGALAHIQCSFAAAEHQVLEIVCEQAAITAPLAFTAWEGDVTTLRVQRGSEIEVQEFAPADPYELMVKHMNECVLGRETPLLQPEESVAMLRTLERLRGKMP